MASVKQYFDAMPASFQKQNAVGLSAVYQFDISGDGGGKWYAEIKDGELSVVEGTHPTPSVTISASADDYAAVAEGRMNGMVAFGTGKMKVKGSIGLATKMGQLFKR